MIRLNTALTSCALFALLTSNAFALDTVEAFDEGLTDAEMYISGGNLNLDRAYKTVGSEIVLGAGLPGGANLTAGLSLEGDGYLNGAGAGALGIFGTVIDTVHFDLDLMLNAGFSATDIELAPGLELNIDQNNDMSGFGFFSGINLVMGHRETAKGEGEINMDLSFTPGLYYTIAEGNQVLVGTEMTLHLDPEDGQDDFEFNAVGLGYNVELVSGFELITEMGVAFDQGEKEDELGFNVSVGFVATLPSASGK